jgi:hypothetical protein
MKLGANEGPFGRSGAPGDTREPGKARNLPKMSLCAISRRF